MILRTVEKSDQKLILDLMNKHWGGEPLVIHGKNYFPSHMDGLLLFNQNQVEGFLLYDVKSFTFEIIVFEVFSKFKGLGTYMLDEFKAIAKAKGCKKLIVMTTNDNLDALRFYQRRGFTVCGVVVEGVNEARTLKPQIPKIGDYGIPMRDEILMEHNL